MEKEVTTILLVDDDEISNYVTESLISEMDVTEEVAIVTDGQQALDFIETHRIVTKGEAGHIMVLLDLNMPVMDGFEFMDEYQQKPWKERVTVIMLTSSSNPKDLNRAKNYNFAGYLQKPFNQEDISRLFSGPKLI